MIPESDRRELEAYMNEKHTATEAEKKAVLDAVFTDLDAPTTCWRSGDPIPLNEIKRQKESCAQLLNEGGNDFYGVWAIKTLLLCEEVERRHAEIAALKARIDVAREYLEIAKIHSSIAIILEHQEAALKILSA